ncbi:hypothetical protein M8C21_013932, partial [Ambrosia artemisiifolia]
SYGRTQIRRADIDPKKETVGTAFHSIKNPPILRGEMPLEPRASWKYPTIVRAVKPTDACPYPFLILLIFLEYSFLPKKPASGGRSPMDKRHRAKERAKKGSIRLLMRRHPDLNMDGPLTVNYANSTLEETVLEINPHSWTKVASIIFVDQPAGTGFAYAKTPEAYITNDTLSAMQAYSFLKKWLVDHPKLLNNPLYVAGDSYMGILLPMIVQEIYNGNEVGEGPRINIKGYSLGNPLTDTGGNYNSRIRYAHRMALLSDAIYKSAEENCDGEYWKIDPNNSLCIQALQVVDKCIGRIRSPQILEPYCDDSNTLKFYLSRRGLGTLDKIFMDTWSLPQVQKQSCRDDNYLYSYVWANNRDVREALHVHEEFGDIEWVRCNDSLYFYYDKEAISYTHDVLNTVGYHQRISDKHCRALIYSGDHDMVAPYISTLDWIESLNLSVVDGWRPWFVDDQVAGYTMKYSKNNYHLTFATVKGGGHTAPEYKPKECLSMFMRWLANDSL